MSQKNRLDFIVIGAAKSGTTTLFEWMRRHPEIYIPPGKELPFFTEDNHQYKKGLAHYLDKNFSGADPRQIWGKITPQYMLGRGKIMPDKIAKRMHKSLPDTKIIAILRHPIERAFSHYKMSVRRGYEKRTFEEAAIELIKPKKLKKARGQLSFTNAYFVASEYGRILENYYSLYPPSNIKVFFAEDLRNNSEDVLRAIFKFLEINSEFTPPNVVREYHKGGSTPKIRLLTPAYLNKVPFLRSLWDNFVPAHIRNRMNFWINRWNIKSDDKKMDKSTRAYSKLVEHFEPDIEKITKLSGKKPPWPDWQ